MQLTRAQLVLLCQQRRLTYSGTKHQLAERLLAHELHTTDPGDITGDLLKCWFLQPTRSESMKAGSNNENLVLSALPSFFKVVVAEWALSGQRSSTFEWKEGVQVGLWYVCEVNHTWEHQ